MPSRGSSSTNRLARASVNRLNQKNAAKLCQLSLLLVRKFLKAIAQFPIRRYADRFV